MAMPLMHTVELNAATVDTDAGPQLQANWTWASSALDRSQITRLSQLWFEALAGICAHVRGGGGGLTPSDIAPARLSQPQIDELQRQYRIADVLPLTPVQQGLLFHASAAHGSDDDLYAVQVGSTIVGALDPDRLHDAVAAVVSRHPHLAARFCDQFDEPVQIIPADPVAAWQYVELDSSDVDARAGRAGVRRRTRRGLRSGRAAGVSGGADPDRRASAPVCADQSPHRAGWLVDADPAAGNIRRLSRPAVARRRSVSPVCDLAGRSRPRSRPRGLG